jgi:hypothetical protein
MSFFEKYLSMLCAVQHYGSSSNFEGISSRIEYAAAYYFITFISFLGSVCLNLSAVPFQRNNNIFLSQ